MGDQVQKPRDDRPWAFAALGVAAFVVYGSLVPFAFRARSPDDAASSFAWAMTNRAAPQSRSDGLANVLIAVPLGFALLGWSCVDRPGLRRAVRCGAAWLPACVLLAAAVEFAQLFLPTRTCAGSDVIAQGIGAAVGMVLWVLVGQRLTEQARAVWARADGAVPRVLVAYLALLAFVQTLPLDLTPSPADLYRKLRDTVRYVPFGEFRGTTEAEAWGRSATLIQVFALYLPVGLLVRLASGTVGWAPPTIPRGAYVNQPRKAVGWAPPTVPRGGGLRGVVGGAHPTNIALLAVGVALGMESLQLVVQSRVPSATDVVIGACGVLCGYRARSRWLILPWLALLAVHAWQPWSTRTGTVAFDWIPGLPLEQGHPLFSLEEFLTKAVLFAPLGLVARRPWLAALVGVTVAAVFEVGQVFVSTRYPCITDVLIGGFGAWAGATAWTKTPPPTPPRSGEGSRNPAPPSLLGKWVGGLGSSLEAR